MKNNNNWVWGFGIVFISGIICFTLSVTNPGWEQSGLVGLLLLAWPVTSTIIEVILYLIIALALKKESWLTVSLIIAVVNILYGISLHRY